MKIYALLVILSFPSTFAVSAASYSTGFDTGFDVQAAVAGQQGWIIDDPTVDLSFFVRMNGSFAAALGGYYDVPVGNSVRLSHAVGIPFAGSSFRVNVAVISSTVLYPGRDAVGFSLCNPSGARIFNLRLEPIANNPASLNVTWSTGTGTVVHTGWSVAYNAPYELNVKFSVAGADLAFTAAVAGTNSFSFSGSIPGLAGETWESVGADFEVRGADAGDNFMVFDDISALPPPPLPTVDADGDGFTAEVEAWFGTSDSSIDSTPVPVMSTASGTPSISFPSVPGNSYAVESSDDLLTWILTPVTAANTTTVWLDSAGPAGRHRYFKVHKP